jgi:hypothetical protein
MGSGHLRASARRLREAGASVNLGLCAGRTVQEPPDDPLAIITETFEDLIPPRRR